MSRISRVKHVVAYFMILSIIKCIKYHVCNEDFCLNPHTLKIKNIWCPTHWHIIQRGPCKCMLCACILFNTRPRSSGLVYTSQNVNVIQTFLWIVLVTKMCKDVWVFNFKSQLLKQIWSVNLDFTFSVFPCL